ncbi:MAG: EVE domain-containing protein [Spartobacteria bacterium]
MKKTTRFWIGSATRDHVLAGVAGGFCQLSHGRPEALRQMSPGDWIVYYSGRESWENKTLCQRFTALGKIVGEEVYQVTMAKNFRPYRRDVAFCRARESDIRPFIPKLAFITNKQYWGLPFRRGYLEVSAADFRRIAEEMLGKEFDPAMRCRKAIARRK